MLSEVLVVCCLLIPLLCGLMVLGYYLSSKQEKRYFKRLTESIRDGFFLALKNFNDEEE